MSKKLKEKIIELREAGLTYPEIAKAIPCSKGTISYHLSEGQKEKTLNRTRELRKNNPLLQKVDNFKQTKPSARSIKNLTSKTHCFQSRSIDERLRTNDEVKEAYARRNHEFRYQDVIERFTMTPKCALSGIQLDLREHTGYSLDHSVPVARGGDNSLENMQILHSRINRMKSDLLDEEFIEWCRIITEYNNLLGDGSEEHF